MENPDFHNEAYNTKTGIYTEGCGLNNVMMSWGHDDYMYMVISSLFTFIVKSSDILRKFNQS